MRSPSRCSAPLAIHGVVSAPELDAAERDVEPRVGRAVEADAVEPDPALGVLGAPVVADHARPGVELPVLDAAGDRRVGQRALGLGARERGVVEAGVGEVAQRRGARAEAAAPRPRCGRAPRRGPVRAARAEVAVADRQPVAGARVGQRLLDRARRLAGLEQRAPQRAGRRAAGALEHGVADPGAAPARRVGGAQVVGLVVALVGRDGGEARGAHRRPCRTPSHSHSG